MDQIYAYPLLILSEDNPPLEVSICSDMASGKRLTVQQQIHKIFIAVRQLWNTRNTLNHDLPWDELEGCRFGLKAIQELLARPGCDRYSKATSVQIDQKIFTALNSTEPSKQMAEFVRWATDAIIGFLTDSSRFGNYTVGSALSKLKSVKECLLENTSRVNQSIQSNNSEEHISFRNTRMLKILSHFFRVIVRHHKSVSNSRIGVEELLLLAEEVDFVKRHHDNKITLHAIFAEHEGDGFPSEVSLSNMALAIKNHIEQRGHPMHFEYAIRIVAPVIPRLSHAILEQLPLHRWSRWFQEVGLEQIGEQLAADVDRQLLPQQRPVTPTPRAPSSVYNTALTHQQSGVASISSSDILEALEGSSGEERSIASHRTNLFGSGHSTPTSAPAHLPEETTKRPMEPALPPTPPDPKRPRQGIDGPQAIDVPAAKKPRTLPASVVPHTHTMSESGWPDGRMEGLAGGLRLPIQRSHAPLDFWASRAAPSGSLGGPRFASGSTPTARIEMWQSTTIQPSAKSAQRRQLQEQNMAGSTEGGGETIGRLRKTRPLTLESDTDTGFHLEARMVDQQHRRSDTSSGGEDDSEEDVEMVDGVDGAGSDGQGGKDDESESESEISEE